MDPKSMQERAEMLKALLSYSRSDEASVIDVTGSPRHSNELPEGPG